jgi:hypothetical protein
MNKNVRAIYEELSMTAGLTFIPKSGIAYGRFDGFSVLINGNNGTSPFTPLVSFFAYREGEDVTPEECRAIRNGVDGIGDCKPTKEGINITVCMCSGKEKFIGYVMESLKTGAQFLRDNGYKSACPGCLEDKDAMPQKIGGTYMMVCDECYKSAVERSKQLKLVDKKERSVLGVLGAIIGSAIGAACIILLGHFGYVTAISGLVMAFATLLCYRLFSGKLTIRGGLISLAIMIIMTFAAHYINYANILTAMHSYTGYTFWYAVKTLPSLYPVPEAREFRRQFFGYLWLLYLYVFVGCVPFIVSLFRKKRTENQITSLGRDEEE